MMRKLEAFAGGVLVVALGCAVLRCLPSPDGCTPLATRCNANVAEICDDNERWGMYLDCNEVAAQSGGTWVCCAPAGDAGAAGATCLPAGTCPQGGN